MTPELTTQEQRAYVESKWEIGSKVPCAPYTFLVIGEPYWADAPKEVDDCHWSAAYTFTVAHEREIAELEAGIDLVQTEANLFEGTQTGIEWEAIMRYLTAILADKKKGMKP